MKIVTQLCTIERNNDNESEDRLIIENILCLVNAILLFDENS